MNHGEQQGPRLREDRQHSLQQALNAAGLDAVVCSSASEVLLLTGYWPIMADTVALFTRSGETHLIVPEDELELASQMSAATITSYEPESLAELTNPIPRLKQPLTTLFKKMGLRSSTLGVLTRLGVQPASYLTSTDFRSSLSALLGELLPSAKLQPCDDLLEQQKSTKSAEELRRMRLGAAVAAQGFAAAKDAIQPGRREAEVASILQAAFDSAPQAEPLHRSYGFFFCMSGPNSATAAAAFARTRQRVLAEGDLVMIHANTCADGLWTDITRTYTVGKPVPRHEEMREAIQAAHTAALAVIRPGAEAHSVDHAARSAMETHGLGKPFKHATGHGVGFAAANANALPRIHPCSPDVLAESMTFNVEPAAYFEGYGGMRHCNVVAVTPKGHEVLTGF